MATYREDILKVLNTDSLSVANKCTQIENILEADVGDYEKAFKILMEYWDSLPDEQKSEINDELNKVGV